jgi:hypothetical protein
MLAEAKFLRAFQYFDLVKNFGGLPLVTSVMMPDEAVGFQRATQAETYAMIEKDLREAIPDLPLAQRLCFHRHGTCHQGRRTRYSGQSVSLSGQVCQC